MQAAGFVLAGGASSRMGRNKAFLTHDGNTLLNIAINAVREAAGNVTIIGSREIYGNIGIPVIADRQPGLGPLGGIETALAASNTDWNVVVACDMPRITGAILRRIMQAAESHPEAGCVLPDSGEGKVEPLCAAYSKRVHHAIQQALAAGIRKVTDALPRESVHYLAMPNEPAFQNINTPEEWEAR